MPLPLYQSDQERNLQRLGFWTLATLFIAVSFVCWWLYAGVGYFKDEMSFSSAYGPRKNPRVPLPLGTVPRDGMGFDQAQLGKPPLQVTYNAKLAAKLYHDNCGFCHAASGRGDTPPGMEYDPPPSDLTQVVPHRTPEQLFDAITNGMNTASIATSPPIGRRWHEFSLYLDENYRRQLVEYLRLAFGPGHELASPATTIPHPAYHIVGNPPGLPQKGKH